MLFNYDSHALYCFTFSRPQIERMDTDSDGEATSDMEIDDSKGNC